MKNIIIGLFVLLIFSCGGAGDTIYVKNISQYEVNYTLKIRGGSTEGEYNDVLHSEGEKSYHVSPNGTGYMVKHESQIPGSVDCLQDGNIFTFAEITPIPFSVKNLSSAKTYLSANGTIEGGEPIEISSDVTVTVTGTVISRTPVFSAVTDDNFPLLVTTSFDGTQFLVTVH